MTFRRAVTIAAAALCITAAAPMSNAIAAPFPQSKTLDAYEPNNDDYAGPVKSAVLAAGVPYVVEVQGTFSYYERQNLRWSSLDAPWKVLCGQPLRRVMFRSTSVKRRLQGRADLDPEFIFAVPRQSASLCAPEYPRHWSNFQMTSTALSGGYAHVEPFADPAAGPTADHKYLYPLLGAGQAAGFRLEDLPRTDDNYGLLRLTIREASPEECAASFTRYGFADASACGGGATTVS